MNYAMRLFEKIFHRQQKQRWKFSFVLLFAFTCSFFLIACPKKQATSSSQKQKKLRIQDYFPLRLGDSRRYRILFAPTKQVIEREIKMISKKGNTFSDSANGVYRYDTHGLRSRLRYLLKYPLQVGNRWLSVVGITTIERYRIIDVKRGVSVPAGYYRNCIVVRSRRKIDSRRTHEALHFYAPSIGLIKYITILREGRNSSAQWTAELLSYRHGQVTPSEINNTQPHLPASKLPNK